MLRCYVALSIDGFIKVCVCVLYVCMYVCMCVCVYKFVFVYNLGHFIDNDVTCVCIFAQIYDAKVRLVQAIPVRYEFLTRIAFDEQRKEVCVCVCVCVCVYMCYFITMAHLLKCNFVIINFFFVLQTNAQIVCFGERVIKFYTIKRVRQLLGKPYFALVERLTVLAEGAWGERCVHTHKMHM